MTKTRKWPIRALYLVVAVMMVLGLMLIPAPVSAEESEFETVGTPTAEDWVIGTETTIMDMGAGGGVLCLIGTGIDMDDLLTDYPANLVNLGIGVIPQLWKSTDFGKSWKSITDEVLECIDDKDLGALVIFNKVVLAPDDGDFIVVAVTTTGAGLRVLISNDGGGSFYDSGDLTDTTPTPDTKFTGIIDKNVSPEVNDMRNIAIAGTGVNAGPDGIFATGDDVSLGLVYRIECINGLSRDWEDASNPVAYEGWNNINSEDPDDPANNISSTFVSTVKFAPSWASDKTVLVTTHSENATYLQSGTWGTSNENKGWNAGASFSDAMEIVDDPSTVELASAAAMIALPSDYAGRHSADRYLWVSVSQLHLDPADPSTDPGCIIYRLAADSDPEPIMRQVSGNPLLASLSYNGSIDEGVAIAGLFGTGHPPAGFDMSTATTGKIVEVLMTDCCEGVQVYRNDSIEDMEICCRAWKPACKPPTGRVAAGVALASPNFAIGIGAYGFDRYYNILAGLPQVGPYDEGGFMVSFDGGDNWNEVSMIDTYIDYLSDTAKSPDCNKTWLASVNSDHYCFCYNATGEIIGERTCDSVWLKADTLSESALYSGAWLRVWCKELTGDPQEGLIRLDPTDTAGETVYLIDRGTDKVYCDLTEGLACFDEAGPDGGSSTVDHICDLAVKDASTIYAVDFDGKVAMSDDYGSTGSWEDPVDSKLNTGHTIAVNGDAVIVGSEEGEVSFSIDGSETFAETKDLPSKAEGNVHVAFDTDFASNNIIYAAVSDGGTGIYRGAADETTKWDDLKAIPSQCQLGVSCAVADGCDKEKLDYTGIVLGTEGALYASYIVEVGSDWYTGIARCLTPAEEKCCEAWDWDFLHESLPEVGDAAFPVAFALEPSALKICGDPFLWAIDAWDYYDGDLTQYDESPYKYIGRLWQYEDCFSKDAPALLSPADDAMVPADPCYCWNDDFTLKWERQCNACSYNLQISLDADFTELKVNWNGKYPGTCLEKDWTPESGKNPTYLVRNFALGTGSCGTTFYWRVRSADAETDEIIHSPWSEVRSFTVEAGTESAIDLINPSNGATNIPLNGVVFTWSAVPDVDTYDITLTDAAGASVDSKTGITGTSYALPDGKLQNDTSYTWQVKAMKGGKVLSASSTATFSSLPPAPAAPEVPPPPGTPSWVWVVIGIGAVLVITVIVLIFRTRRV